MYYTVIMLYLLGLDRQHAAYAMLYLLGLDRQHAAYAMLYLLGLDRQHAAYACHYGPIGECCARKRRILSPAWNKEFLCFMIQ